MNFKTLMPYQTADRHTRTASNQAKKTHVGLQAPHRMHVAHVREIRERGAGGGTLRVLIPGWLTGFKIKGLGFRLGFRVWDLAGVDFRVAHNNTLPPLHLVYFVQRQHQLFRVLHRPDDICRLHLRTHSEFVSHFSEEAHL